MKLKGAFWPDLRKVGSERIQLDLDCSPEVSRLFHPSFVITGIPISRPIFIHEATAEEWETMAAKWCDDEVVSPAVDLGLEHAHLH